MEKIGGNKNFGRFAKLGKKWKKWYVIPHNEETWRDAYVIFLTCHIWEFWQLRPKLIVFLIVGTKIKMKNNDGMKCYFCG